MKSRRPAACVQCHLRIVTEAYGRGYTSGMTETTTEQTGARAERANRLSAVDWAAAALAQISSHGVASVAVEPLARTLGVTKGSFYWHFPSRDALLQAALDRWEAYERDNIFSKLEAVDDPKQRLGQLINLVAHDDKSHIIYKQLLKAMDHPLVQPVIGRVSRRRLEWVRDSFAAAGFTPDDARHRARLLYSAYVGFQQLNLQTPQDRPPQEEYEAYVSHLMDTLIHPPTNTP